MNVVVMRAAIADVDELLGQVIEMVGSETDIAATPQRAATLDGTVQTYISLAAVAVERFEEAARGA